MTKVHLHQTFWHDDGTSYGGPSNPRAIMVKCEVPLDLTGLDVLDIGAYNGSATLECLKRGAASVDALDVRDFSETGIDKILEPYSDRATFIRASVYDIPSPQKMRLLGSKGPASYDVILFWGVLYHLRYPLLALDKIRERLAPSTGKLYVESHTIDGNEPIARFYQEGELSGDASNWFGPTILCVQAWLESAGFSVEYKGNWQSDRSCFVCSVDQSRPTYSKTANFQAIQDYEN